MLCVIGDCDVIVEVNSSGGDFFEGVVIYNMFRVYFYKVMVKILGFVVFVVLVIVMVGDEIEIGKVGFVMIYNVWGVVIGNCYDFVEVVIMIELFDDVMVIVYFECFGVEKIKVVEWMDNEIWFNGE